MSSDWTHLSPASTPTPREKIQASVRYLEKLGYRVRVGEHASKAWGYLAGTDEERAEDLNAMIRDPEVKAIFALRGGYGTPRILPLIAYRALARRPKIISGFSDITALQLAIYRKCKLVTFSGPMPAVEFWKDPDPFTEENFWRLLTRTRRLENWQIRWRRDSICTRKEKHEEFCWEETLRWSRPRLERHSCLR